ncbi:MAG: flavodoxin [Bacteroidales bacterium]|nr:flavodoxin [Tenuifilaceae bacterium]
MKTAIIYSHKTNKTTKVAKMISEAFESPIDDLDVESIEPNVFNKYDLLILGVPTWFDGELPSYWDEMVSAVEDLDLKNTKVALFGNGDQVNYSENFGDAVGLLAEVLESSHAQIIGKTSTKTYTFEASKALSDDSFVGLILDFENQNKLNKERVSGWVKQLKKEIVS